MRGRDRRRDSDRWLVPALADRAVLSGAHYVGALLHPGPREGISDRMAWGTGAVLVISVLAINVFINRLAVRLVKRGVKL